MLRSLLLLLFLAASAQAASVTTFAGTGTKGFSGDGGPASAAQLNNPFAVSRGPDGALYVCDVDNQRIRRIAPDGTISTFAGNGTKGYSGDGSPATAAALNEPYELAWDKAGNLFFVERVNHLVRRVEAKTGVISTVAGTGQPGFAGDGGPGVKAQFNQPHSLAFDPEGDLFVCDIGNHRVRKIAMAEGTIWTFAGTGEKKPTLLGKLVFADRAPLHGPRALGFDASGSLWLALREGNSVWRIAPGSGTIHHVAGTGKQGFTGNGGPEAEATLSGPKGLSIGPDGNVYLADTESHSIRMIDLTKGTIELLVGDGKKGDGPDGDPLKCQLARPHGVFADKDGAIYIGDSENHRIRVLRR